MFKCRRCGEIVLLTDPADPCPHCGGADLVPVSVMTDRMSDGGMRNEVGDWGRLDGEPCRFCHRVNCVYFRVDDSPRGKVEDQVVRCDKCGRDWIAGSPA